MRQLSQRGVELLEQMHARRATEQPGQQTLEFMQEANRRLFLAECYAAEIDPAGGVSPSLRKLLKQNPVPLKRGGGDVEPL